MAKKMGPLAAIRAKCLDCVGGQVVEVRECTADECSLHQFRFGKNPARAGVGGKSKTAQGA